MRIIALVTLFTLTFIPTLHAQVFEAPEPPSALQEMVEQGSQIFFLGQFEGMNGWALIREGRPEYFYENESRTAMVMGLAFNEGGEMITMAQLKDLNDRVGDDMYAVTGGALSSVQNQGTQSAQVAQAPVATTPQASPSNRPLTQAERMYTDLIAANWLTMNPDGAYDMFAFIDPDCPHCQKFISDMAENPYGMRLRIIPMGLNEDGIKRAAVLLASNDASRLVRYVNGDKTALTAPDNISLDAVENNFSVMAKHGFDVTPVIVYRTGKGEIRLIRGRPANMDMVVNDIQNN